jgi:NADH-quinone oxidoreductase subunit L
MFFGWEGVGLASYLLIGFWYRKPSANAAAIKAFVVNRVGDFGFMLGIFGTFWCSTRSRSPTSSPPPRHGGQRPSPSSASLRYDDGALPAAVRRRDGQVGAAWPAHLAAGRDGRPDAGLGADPRRDDGDGGRVHGLPPVADVRTSPTALHVVTYVGAPPAFFAATVGTVQNDIKRVIAYSTCSQLGYMFFAAGVGAYGAAMFHLFTHAFFKALLFLGAGSVIHAMHHEQDMRYYGGCVRKIPLTFWAMTIGTLAITGVGIPGTLFGFAGFFSKDAILESAYAAGGPGTTAFLIGVFAALLTSFYSWRLVFLTFFGNRAGRAASISSTRFMTRTAMTTMRMTRTMITITAMMARQAIIRMKARSTCWSRSSCCPWARCWQASSSTARSSIRKAARISGKASTLAFNEHLMHASHGVPLWVKWSPFAVMATASHHRLHGLYPPYRLAREVHGALPCAL